MKRVKIRLDVPHTLELMAGNPIAIKIPKGAEVLELQPAKIEKSFQSELVKLCDVVFNGRPA